MRIWLINHYGVPPKYYPLARPTLFAKNLERMGHEVIIFASSAVHNSDINLIEDNSLYRKDTVDGVNYVYIRSRQYKGNDKDRVMNLLEFAARLPIVCKHFKKPDTIVSTSFDPVSCYQGIRIAKKYHAKAIAEIADLWPETLVVYNGLSSWNPVVLCLRKLERSIYRDADRVVFTSAGAYGYIIDKGWENKYPKEKFAYINNGIDIKLFDYNREKYIINDPTLECDGCFKVIYAGSIRKVNDVGRILDVAKKIRNERIKFLVWGDGDELKTLKERTKEEGINNVVFKGRVDKKYIPYITSKADLNYAHNQPSPMFKYGISFNKIFDYFAAGRPILCDFPCKYNPVIMGEAGFEVKSANPEDIARKIEEIADMNEEKMKKYCIAARKNAEKYDFGELTKKLIDVIEGIKTKGDIR